MASIIKTESKKHEGSMLVVVSAFSTSTRDLEFAANLAAKGIVDDAVVRLQQVIADHRSLVKALLPPPTIIDALSGLLADVEKQITVLLHGIGITRQLTPKTLDRILAFGEYLALHITHHILQTHSVESASVDATLFIVTDNNYGAAIPNVEKTSLRIEHEVVPLFAKHRVVVTQGFVGRAEDGTHTTMGKESSNLTATLIGSILKPRIGVDEVVIVTDVAGVRSGDPHVCDRTVVREHMSYTQARQAAALGLKLLYPTMIEPAERAGLAIRITSAADYDGENTTISLEECTPQPIIVITASKPHELISVVSLFANQREWIEICSRATALLNEDDNFNVIANAASAPLMQVPSHRAESLARFFHQELILSKELIA